MYKKRNCLQKKQDIIERYNEGKGEEMMSIKVKGKAGGGKEIKQNDKEEIRWVGIGVPKLIKKKEEGRWMG